MPWWKLPLSSEPYRYTLFLVLAIPLAVWSLVDRGGAQRRVAARLLARASALSRLRGLAAVPLDALSLLVIGYCGLGVVLNIAYPARSLVGMNNDYRTSWGGPTLAGAWAVHALGGAALWLVGAWGLHGVGALWFRIAGSV